MKNVMTRSLLLLFILTIHCTSSYGQEITLNESTNFYEYSFVKDSIGNDLMKKFENRLRALNYKEISILENSISGKGFTNYLVGGFATVEITYVVKINFKENRFKMTFTNFVVADKNGSNPLEGLGSYKKNWIKIINEKLPDIVKNVRNLKNEDDW